MGSPGAPCRSMRARARQRRPPIDTRSVAQTAAAPPFLLLRCPSSGAPADCCCCYHPARSLLFPLPQLYIVYIARCAHRFGVARTREIYESSIKHLPDHHVKSMCLKYASLEKKLGEVDRARAIYQYGAQFCDPRIEAAYWSTWSDFEVSSCFFLFFLFPVWSRRAQMCVFFLFFFLSSPSPHFFSRFGKVSTRTVKPRNSGAEDSLLPIASSPARSRSHLVGSDFLLSSRHSHTPLILLFLLLRMFVML